MIYHESQWFSYDGNWIQSSVLVYSEQTFPAYLSFMISHSPQPFSVMSPRTLESALELKSVALPCSWTDPPLQELGETSSPSLNWTLALGSSKETNLVSINGYYLCYLILRYLGEWTPGFFLMSTNGTELFGLSQRVYLDLCLSQFS